MIKWVISLGSVLAAVATVFTFFGTYGWVTRAAYAQDQKNIPSQTQMDSIEALLTDIHETQQENQARWECDEIDEELPEVQSELDEATDPLHRKMRRHGKHVLTT